MHLVSIGLLGDALGDLDGAVADLGEGRVQPAHGVVAVRDLETQNNISRYFFTMLRHVRQLGKCTDDQLYHVCERLRGAEEDVL